MSTKTKFSESDAKLSMMMERRNLSDGAIKNYNVVFKEIYELFGVTPSDIVKRGKEEQKPFMNKETSNYDIIELEDRTVSEYQFKYYTHLKNKELANTTIKLKLDTYRALLGEYNIEKPKAINLNIQNDRIRDEDIVSWREVERALSFCKSIRDKAIISFFSTTGLRSSDVRRLKIKDLIKACDIYFEDGEDKTIDNLLNKKPDEIFPCWEIMPSKTSKKSQLCVTFNTPEATDYIWQYLKNRIEYNIERKRNEKLEPDYPLFATSTNRELTSSAIEQLFQRLNKELGDKKDKNGKYRRFRSHSLRKLFSTTCRRNLTQIVVNSDKTSEIDIISIFTGHVPPNESNSKVYEAIESDSQDSYLRKTYQSLSPYLSIQNIEIKDIKTQQYKDLEEQNKALKKQLDAQTVTMQREMDEQKEKYEKRINHMESINSALSSQINDIQNQLDNLANANDLKRIQEYIAGHPLVEEYNLAPTVIEYCKEDIKKEDFAGVTYSYIEDLIMEAYNTKVARQPIIDDEDYKTNPDWKLIDGEIAYLTNSYCNNAEYNFTKAQEKRMIEKLDKYAKFLWENKQEIDEFKVYSIIDNILVRD